jgi:hypothetical protein
MRMDAQSSLKDYPVNDSAHVVALRQYHSYVAPEVGLYRGTQYVDYDFTVQKGQPFFGPDSIRYGSVWYAGIWYDHVRMLFDLVKDQLAILDPYNTYKISLYMDLVDSFSLDGLLFKRITDSLAPAALRSGYWASLYQGRIGLLKRERKFMHENIVITPDNIRLYIDGYTSFYLRKAGRYYPVNTKKDLFDLLKVRRSDVRQLARKNNLTWGADKEQLLQLVVARYDGVNQ